jgi:hypothetical protein
MVIFYGWLHQGIPLLVIITGIKHGEGALYLMSPAQYTGVSRTPSLADAPPNHQWG